CAHRVSNFDQCSDRLRGRSLAPSYSPQSKVSIEVSGRSKSATCVTIQQQHQSTRPMRQKQCCTTKRITTQVKQHPHSQFFDLVHQANHLVATKCQTKTSFSIENKMPHSIDKKTANDQTTNSPHNLNLHSGSICRQSVAVAQHHDKNDRPSLLLSLLLATICVYLLSLESNVCNAIVVERVRFVATPAGRSDYALLGESVEISCHYLMQHEDEKILSIVWTKDKHEVLRYRSKSQRLEIVSRILSGHVKLGSTPTNVMLTNVTLAMHGTYTCTIVTDMGQSSNEIALIVITPNACRTNDWHFESATNKCTEHVQFDCRSFHPLPVPACGLWNTRLAKFISSVLISIVPDTVTSTGAEQSGAAPVTAVRTYRVSYSNVFEFNATTRVALNGGFPIQQNTMTYDKTNKLSLISDHQLKASASETADTSTTTAKQKQAMLRQLRPPNGLTFRCELMVPDTTWRLNIEKELFYEPFDCYEDPLEYLARIRRNLTALVTGALSLSEHAHHMLPPATAASSEMKSNELDTDHYSIDDYSSSNNLMRYELLGPTNCWHRARHKSMARFSCVASEARLRGAQYLECHAGEWRLLTSAGSMVGLSSQPKSSYLKLNSNNRDRNNNNDEEDDFDDHHAKLAELDVEPLEPIGAGNGGTWTPARALAELPTCVIPVSRRLLPLTHSPVDQGHERVHHVHVAGQNINSGAIYQFAINLVMLVVAVSASTSLTLQGGSSSA
ncbi:hypothetical protein GZH46_02407, partial [Fragariocoptes setiger]